MNSAEQTETKKFKIQDKQYSFPYHHLLSFPDFNNSRIMMSGIEHFGFFGKVLEVIERLQFDSLIDVGCGDGKLQFELAKKFPGKKLVGIDLSERAILFAKAFNYGNDAVFEVGDISQIEEKFDVVSLIETLEHIPDEEISAALSHVERILKNGGYVVVSVPAATIPVQTKHYRHYTLPMLKEYFRNYRLKETHFVVKRGFVHRLFVYFTYKFASFAWARKIFEKLAKIFLFQANEINCRHIITVFQKP